MTRRLGVPLLGRWTQFAPILSFVTLLMVAACGDTTTSDDPGMGLGAAAATAQADTCSPSIVDWPATATNTDKVCSGNWQYYTDKCCFTGYTGSLTCRHADQFVDLSASTTQAPISCQQPCIQWQYVCDGATAATATAATSPGPNIPPPGCVKTCVAWGAKTCTYPDCSTNTGTNALAATTLNSVTGALAGCTVPGGTPAPYVKSATASAPDPNWNRTCSVVVANAPKGHDGAVPKCDAAPDRALCGPDPATITYGRCTGTLNPDGSAQYQAAQESCPQLRAYSGLDTSLATLCASVPALQQPVCLSCEGEFPLGSSPTDKQVQDKYTCLKSRRDAPPADLANPAPLRERLVRHQKLLFEYFGNKLLREQQADADALYTTWPSTVPGCGTSSAWVPPSGATGCGATGTLDGKFTLCDRMAHPHTASAAATLEANLCVGAILDAKAQPPSCSTRSAYFSAYPGLSTEHLRKAFSTLPDTLAADRAAKLQDRLATIDQWYRYLRDEVQEPQSDRWRDASAVTGALVQGAYANSVTALDASLPGNVVPTNAQHLMAGYAVDREILDAALTDKAPGGPPLTTAPALFVLANGLRAMSDRLHEVDFFHDLGCRFKTNCGIGFASEVSQAHSLRNSSPAPVVT